MTLADVSDASLVNELVGWFLTLVGIGLAIASALGAWGFWSMKSYVQNSLNEMESRLKREIEQKFADSKMTDMSLTTHDRQISSLARRVHKLESRP